MNHPHHPKQTVKIAALTLVTALLLSSVARAADPVKPAAPAPAAKPAAPAAASEPRMFGGQIAEAVTVKATVEKINYETREVVLKGENGELRTITAGPEVLRLAEVKQGDTIEAVYVESLIVLFGDGSGTMGRSDTVELERASKDQKPGGVAVATTRVQGTVEALDFKARTATLKGPKRTVTITVGPDAVNFEKAKVGDSVYLEFTQAVAMAVTKSAAVAK